MRRDIVSKLTVWLKKSIRSGLSDTAGI
jgi:hypothetical protein